jgi:hypothetical protein
LWAFGIFYSYLVYFPSFWCVVKINIWQPWRATKNLFDLFDFLIEPVSCDPNRLVGARLRREEALLVVRVGVRHRGPRPGRGRHRRLGWKRRAGRGIAEHGRRWRNGGRGDDGFAVVAGRGLLEPILRISFGRNVSRKIFKLKRT